MEIKYFGHSCFSIKTAVARVITDPFDPQVVGFSLPKLEADIVTVSHQHPDHNNSPAVGDNPLIIDWPGEFEKQEVRIFGYSSFHDNKKGAERGENILYKFEMEGITILHCGDLGVVPDNGFIADVGEVDILLVPVGGLHTIDSAQAAELVKKIEPTYVIPMHYNTPGLNQEQFPTLAGVDEFIHKMGVPEPEPIDKLVLKKEDIMQEEMKVVVMKITP
ncbi:MBL fold metallo-hydrolase [Candidatus Roizmanbacteria bacterium]|nr:MBL fold metallo-hydrolase [Candidatus Roizmanbacteria bacterium]